MKIALVPNSDANADTLPFIASISVVEATVDFETEFIVPVYRSHPAGKTAYDAEVCGFRMETDTIEHLPALMGNVLRGLINMSRLPSYIFVARRSRQVYPVYTVGREVFATTPGGPVFRHVELAKVRDYLADYLHAVKILGSPGKSDKLHVRGVNAKTLQTMRPILYLKKRVAGETDFWAPVFETRDGKRIYTYAASVRREVPRQNGTEILELRSLVAQALRNDGRLSNPYDLRPDRLMPEYWLKLKNQLTLIPPDASLLPFGIELYRQGELRLAVEERLDEKRFNLFVGTDAPQLVCRVLRVLSRRGVLPSVLPSEPVANPKGA